MYSIEYEDILKKWVVFEKRGNLWWQVFADKYKKKCKEWIKENAKK